MTGYLLNLDGSLITWKTKKQGTVSRFSAEAEYRALGATTSEVIWVIGLLEDLSVHQNGPVKVHCDSKAAIHIAVNPMFHERMKHLEIDCHFVRENVTQGVIILQHVRSKNQEADLLTKAISREI